MMTSSRRQLEAQLDDFNAAKRRDALDGLMKLAAAGEITLPAPGKAVNLHCHTFFSFNGYGYSPTSFAWRARCAGLAVAGIVDFDVLDAVDEFLDASRRLGLRGCAGIETRIFLPEFHSRELNSPGEPGIAYYMGVGFTSCQVAQPALLDKLREIARTRNLGVLSRVNPYLEPVAIDYEDDVIPLTPKGNATERHLCAAYEAKAESVFPDDSERAAFWAAKLGREPGDILKLFPDSPSFQGLIRSKTMKMGGVGYVQPDGTAFPRLDEVNEFILAAGAIPAYAWLNGLTPGEQAVEELLDLLQEAGTAAINIIPDRNWNIADADKRKTKAESLHAFAEIVQSRDLPIVVGTEMNAYGQKFVDEFDAPELAPLAPVFLEGAYTLYGHTILQAAQGMGYTSDWARRHFDSAKAKNAFFARIGGRVDPAADLPDLTAAMPAEDVLSALGL